VIANFRNWLIFNFRLHLYLEYYKGTTLGPNGKTKVLRDYEYLNLYLSDPPKNPIEKNQNKQTLELANVIKAQRELDIKNGQYGFTSDFKTNTIILEFFKVEVDKRHQSKGNSGNWKSTLKHLTSFVLEYYHLGISFREVDEKFCQGFKDYLVNKATSVAGKPLSTGTRNSYYTKFKTCLKQAVKEKIIQSSPAEHIPLPKIISSKRDWLTLSELGKLAQEECRYPVLKKAFLFSCLTGMRWIDCQNLLWENIRHDDNGWKVVFNQQKTKGLQYLDISEDARQFLGQEGKQNERVFIGLKYSSYMNTALHQWIMRGGITKDITFHCSRHSFAMNQIDSGTDILTLRDMLGHFDLKTTLIYASASDTKKREAANRLTIPGLNLDKESSELTDLQVKGERIADALQLQKDTNGLYMLNGEVFSSHELAEKLRSFSS
jgi:integrase/recombinase XerD